MPGGRRPAPPRRVPSLAVGVAVFVTALGAALVPHAAGAQDGDLPGSTTTTTTTTPAVPAPTTTVPLPDDPAEIVPPPPAVEGDTVPPAPPLPGLVDGRDAGGQVQGPSDGLLSVPLTSLSYDAAEAVRRRAIEERDDARAALADLEAELAGLGAREAALTTREADVRSRRDAVAAEREAVVGDLRAIAVARYVSDGVPLEELEADLALPLMEQRRVTATMATEAIGTSSRRAANLQSRLSALQAELDDVVDDLEDVREELRRATARRGGLQAGLADSEERLATAQLTVGKERSTALVAGSDINFTALDAYWRAAWITRITDPACRLDWWGLAGIGRSESRHGVHAGAVPNRDGTPVAPIIGIPLDGTRNTRVILDTDGGALDGDPVHDRAVGPMQFIPSTWRRWAADGSGDGVADPQNFYDATLAAARYLCAGGRRLDTDAGLMSGYLSYNRDLGYMATVLRWARAYQLLPVPSVWS